MKRDLLIAVFVIMLAALITTFGPWVYPSNWPSIKKLFTTSLLQTIFIILIIAVIGLVMWAVLRKIGELDKAKDTRKIAEMKEAFKQALKEVGLAKEIEGEQQSEVKSKNEKQNIGKEKTTKRKLRSK